MQSTIALRNITCWVLDTLTLRAPDEHLIAQVQRMRSGLGRLLRTHRFARNDCRRSVLENRGLGHDDPADGFI
ncbi:hypothetical protein FB472_2681 [Rhodoglobus vestalii]|uniref:Uncharacterized protein n=1 Tax=Rhodoglobus vestalii TaxID=193384 RepID=A0A8H2KD81_9MICO|nr:hypothetical protein FB472_2681 [Rhodoglobus vestalii]